MPKNISHSMHCRKFIAFLYLGFAPFSGAQESAQSAVHPLIANAAEPGAVTLAHAGRLAPLLMDDSDFPGVIRAVHDLQADFNRVTGIIPALSATPPASAANTIIIGTLGKNRVIDQLARDGKLKVDEINGHWESFIIQVVPNPLPGIDQALVITGSDKRGTIFGIYELSRQIGVSPWYWWADVPVKHQSELFARPVRIVEGEPVVKYRGIFLNDEAPALTNWTREKFGGYNHQFYEKIFELLLRLRANYLWPAMWGSAFNDDDSLNAKLADEYGIVMGTSHHEPLMRAHDEWRRFGHGPWDYSKNDSVLRDFWRGSVERTKNYENIQSLGMRGDGDEPMSEQANVALLERIVADQRKILSDVTGRDPATVPQLWALYKEVQGYYERGMRVPDDVTLLWCDDNWGNIRRLPTEAERKRPGGAGVYYHFDYVGGPRNYKWLNTVPLAKIWEQMNLAWQYDANRIWIVNVGDLKPMEFPIEFFLTFAWNPAAWPYERLDEYSRAWAARQFGTEHATEIAALLSGYTKLNGRRKPEMLAPDTFSLVNYHEAEAVEAEWDHLVELAEQTNARLAPEYRDAFFQLVLYPVKASAGVQKLYFAAGRNRLYARQGRTDTNAQAGRVRELFAADRALAQSYHSLKDGKWNHQMDQIKLGYTTWQQPEIETMPAIQEVLPRSGSSMAVTIEGSETAWPSYAAPAAVLPPLDSLNPTTTRWIDIFNRGAEPFSFQASTDVPGVVLSQSKGSIGDKSTRLNISADWGAIPTGKASASITIDSGAAGRLAIKLPLSRAASAPSAGFAGFVASEGCVSIEASHFSRAISNSGIQWKTLSDFGRTFGGVTAFPVTAPAITPGADSPRLEYDFFTSSPGDVTLDLHCAPSLDFQPGDGLRLGVSFDDQPARIIKLDTWQTLQTWEKSVGDGIRHVISKHNLDRPGAHVLKIWFVTPGIVLEKVVLDLGGVRPSYLGPPESARIPTVSPTLVSP